MADVFFVPNLSIFFRAYLDFEVGEKKSKNARRSIFCFDFLATCKK